MTVTFVSLATRFSVSFEDITDNGCKRVSRSWVESRSIWTTGAKLRTHRFPNVYEYYAFLSMLRSLKLLTEQEYDVAYQVGLQLEYDSLTAEHDRVDSSKTVRQHSLTW